MIRAFIAIEIPGDIRAAIGEAQARLRRAHVGVKISWTKVENVHVTLQFLGYIEEEAIPKISAGLESVSRNHAPFELRVRGAGAFPNENRPRVLWVGCEDAQGKLKALATAVQAAMQPLGFEPERREFSAHLTLGRVKLPKPDAALTRALDSIKNEVFGAMRVEAVHLFESQLNPEGSIYSKLSSHELKGDFDHAAKS
jgi:2'-5' RNA ligase